MLASSLDRPYSGRTWRKWLLPLAVVVLSGLLVSGCMPTTLPQGWSGAKVDGGTLFYGSMEGELVALEASNGNLLWNPFTLEAPKSSGGFGCAQGSSAVAIYGSPEIAGELV